MATSRPKAYGNVPDRSSHPASTEGSPVSRVTVSPVILRRGEFRCRVGDVERVLRRASAAYSGGGSIENRRLQGFRGRGSTTQAFHREEPMRQKASVRCPEVCRLRGRAVRLLVLLALCSPLGCATLSLHEGILQQPRLQTGGYPQMQNAQEFGPVELGQGSYRFVLARDPRWTGKDVYRQMALLIPDPASERPVLLLARARYFSEQPFDRDRFSVCVGSDADAATILAFWDGTRRQQAQPVLLAVAKPEASAHSAHTRARRPQGGENRKPRPADTPSSSGWTRTSATQNTRTARRP